MYYHVRARNGQTIDWLGEKAPALVLALKEGAEVYEVDKYSGMARRVF